MVFRKWELTSLTVRVSKLGLLLCGNYTNWPEVALTSSIATTAITTFLSTVFARLGNPTELVSDNGTQFTSSEFVDFIAERDITHRKVSLHYPQANGSAESWNCVLKEILLRRGYHGNHSFRSSYSRTVPPHIVPQECRHMNSCSAGKCAQK